MTHRAHNRHSLIVSTVVERKAENWSEETRKVANTDAQRVLEALIAEYGVENAMRALDNQGFKGRAYGYLLQPLYIEALQRRMQYRALNPVVGHG